MRMRIADCGLRNWGMGNGLIGRVLRFFKPRVIRARGMSDRELLAAFDVEEDHRVLQGVLELIARGKDQCLSEAGASVAGDRETAFYLGGRYGLEQLEGYIVNLRVEAIRQREKNEEVRMKNGE